MSAFFLFNLDVWQIALTLLVSALLFVLLGRYVGEKFFAEREKDSSVLGSIFAILGLMLAFTFGMSLTRFEKRIDIVIEESNDISTAILRADLYPEPYRQQFRNEFKQYVEARIAYFEAGADTAKIFSARRNSDAISQRIWNLAMQLAKDPNVATVASMQMTPALNAMIDITNTRWYMTLNKVPEPVLYVLFGLISINAFLLGYTLSGKKMDWLATVGVLLLICVVIHLIIDIDRPRRGVITLKETNQSIVDLRKMFE